MEMTFLRPHCSWLRRASEDGRGLVLVRQLNPVHLSPCFDSNAVCRHCFFTLSCRLIGFSRWTAARSELGKGGQAAALDELCCLAR